MTTPSQVQFTNYIVEDSEGRLCIPCLDVPKGCMLTTYWAGGKQYWAVLPERWTVRQAAEEYERLGHIHELDSIGAVSPWGAQYD